MDISSIAAARHFWLVHWSVFVGGDGGAGGGLVWFVCFLLFMIFGGEREHSSCPFLDEALTLSDEGSYTLQTC